MLVVNICLHFSRLFRWVSFSCGTSSSSESCRQAGEKGNLIHPQIAAETPALRNKHTIPYHSQKATHVHLCTLYIYVYSLFNGKYPGCFFCVDPFF